MEKIEAHTDPPIVRLEEKIDVKSLEMVPKHGMLNAWVLLSSPYELTVCLLYLFSVRFHFQKLYFEKPKEIIPKITSLLPLSHL